MLEFSLPSNDLSLSTVFSNLQGAKSQLRLQDFSVSQTTLDQVFVGFANQQVNDFHQKAVPTADKSITSKVGFTNSAFVDSAANLSSKPAKSASPQKAPLEVCSVSDAPKALPKKRPEKPRREPVASSSSSKLKPRAPSGPSQKSRSNSTAVASAGHAPQAARYSHSFKVPCQSNTKTTRF